MSISDPIVLHLNCNHLSAPSLEPREFGIQSDWATTALIQFRKMLPRFLPNSNKSIVKKVIIMPKMVTTSVSFDPISQIYFTDLNKLCSYCELTAIYNLSLTVIYPLNSFSLSGLIISLILIGWTVKWQSDKLQCGKEDPLSAL